MYKVEKFTENRLIKQFINLPWSIYSEDKNWIPPLKRQLYKNLTNKNNPLFINGPHLFFMVYKDKKPVGRVLCGINHNLNEKKDKKEGYLSLFECNNDEKASKLIFDEAVRWLVEKGMQKVVGPVSPTNGEDSRGILIKGFEGPPVLMNSYNPKYYIRLFENYGFNKEMDLFAYYLNGEELDRERYGRVVEYAMNRYGFHIDRFDKRNIKREVQDIKKVLDASMPDTWEHLTPPSIREIRSQADILKGIMDEDLVHIARTGDKPVGLVVALPDYNQVLKRINGRMFPFGIFKFLWYKRKINGVRILMQFVVPQFRNKAVNGAIFHKLMIEAGKKGYTWGEGSCIAEINRESIRSVEGVGGKLYRIYRIYGKSIS